jgi:predicted nuclease of predicted toxin-antitoxin system
MRILVDENIPNESVWSLIELNHDVKDVRRTRDEGIPDDKIWSIAQTEERLLITTDKGFSQFRYLPHHGMLLILLKQPTLDKIHQRIMRTMSDYSENDWKNRIVIVKDTVKSTWKNK